MNKPGLPSKSLETSGRKKKTSTVKSGKQRGQREHMEASNRHECEEWSRTISQGEERCKGVEMRENTRFGGVGTEGLSRMKGV